MARSSEGGQPSPRASLLLGAGDWQVDADRANPDIDREKFWVGTPFIGAVRDLDARIGILPSASDAANAVIADGYKKQKYVGDPPAAAWTECVECPFEPNYGYGTYARHDLFASGNSIAKIVHIADIVLERDGWATTGVPSFDPH